MIKTAIVGLGKRGTSMLKTALACFDNLEFVGVCDLFPERIENAQKIIEEKTGKVPFGTVNAKEIFDLDIECVLVMTSWEAHIPLSIAAMKKGIRVGVEVGGAYSLDDCYELLRTYEETGVPVMMLENSSFRQNYTALYKMAKQGDLGEIVHCQGGYKHYLANEILCEGLNNHHYRLRNYKTRNCDNYPTHELHPIMRLLNINRGNRMVKLTSTASKSVGLKAYIKEHMDELSSLADETFNQGDVITTVITCADGATILISLDTTLPRAYDQDLVIRGTKASYFASNNSLFFDNNKEHHKAEYSWEKFFNNAKEYFDKNKSYVWEKYADTASDAGHGGIDYMILAAFFESVEKKIEPVIDTYDTVTLMCITPLSEMSIMNGGAPVAIPDFTCGKWAMDRPEYDFEFGFNK